MIGPVRQYGAALGSQSTALSAAGRIVWLAKAGQRLLRRSAPPWQPVNLQNQHPRPLRDGEDIAASNRVMRLYHPMAIGADQTLFGQGLSLRPAAHQPQIPQQDIHAHVAARLRAPACSRPLRVSQSPPSIPPGLQNARRAAAAARPTKAWRARAPASATTAPLQPIRPAVGHRGESRRRASAGPH